MLPAPSVRQSVTQDFILLAISFFSVYFASSYPASGEAQVSKKNWPKIRRNGPKMAQIVCHFLEFESSVFPDFAYYVI